VFKNYLATKTDLETIEEGLKAAWRPELNFVFRKKELIGSIIVVSYDSKYIYLWIPVRNKPGNYFLRKISHSLSIPPEYHYAWYAGLWEKIEELLPASIKKASRFAVPRIGGGLLTSFIGLQKSFRTRNNPYTTRESYLATIIHEFGHIYWSQHRLWWCSDKKENLQCLKTAIQLYRKQRKTPKIHLWIPCIEGISELFASCTEYCASELFWPRHKRNLDLFAQNWLEKLTSDEKKKDLDKEDSVLEPSRDPHTFAMVYGKILITYYPRTWFKILFTRPKIF